MLKVCDNNVYKTQMCTSLYYSTDKCTGQWCCGSTLLSDPRGCLVNEISSKAIQQANQEAQQDDHHLQHVSNQQEGGMPIYLVLGSLSSVKVFTC